MDIIAPGIAERQPVNEPLQTGIKAIDSMIPIGRGQRELIIGDRKTGKTAIAIDTIINQKGKGVKCFYVAIGSKESTVAGIVEVLRAARRDGVHDRRRRHRRRPRPAAVHRPLRRLRDGRVLHVEGRAHAVRVRRSFQAGRRVSPAVAAAAPPARPRGVSRRRVLSPQPPARTRREAVATRTAAARSPPCRSSKRRKAKCRPTSRPTSSRITDGQIYLEPDLFFAGVRPAINVGISVSRVGGNAQTKAMKKIAGSLRLDLAAYRELEAFAQLGTELDKATQTQLDRGARLVELLKQPQYKPMPVEQEVMVIYAGTKGFLDDVPLNRVQEFQNSFLQLRRQRSRRPAPAAWPRRKS